MDRIVQWHHGHVTAEDRAAYFGHDATTLWLTGLSGSGKLTLAFALEMELLSRGHACYVLDGDNIRHGLNGDLGFSQADRHENIRRIAEVARLFNDAGMFVVTAFISPYREDRRMARDIIGTGRFFECHVATPIEVCEQRDPKGMYVKARQGAIPGFTGVSAPYEAPENPFIRLDTAGITVGDGVSRLLDAMAARFRR